MQTQWRVSAGFVVVYTGLDYAGVMAVINATIKRKDRVRVFDQVRVMEEAALPVLNSRSKSDG